MPVVRKVVSAVIGVTVLLLPDFALIVITWACIYCYSTGLAVLASEFAWARLVLKRMEHFWSTKFVGDREHRGASTMTVRERVAQAGANFSPSLSRRALRAKFQEPAAVVGGDNPFGAMHR